MTVFDNYKNFLITLDTCAARSGFYEAISLLENAHRLAPSDVEEKQFLVSIPDQTIREQVNINGGNMMPHYIDKYIREGRDKTGLVKFWQSRGVLSDIYSVETGYCKSFVEKLSTEFMPGFLTHLKKLEDRIDRTSVRTTDWLKYVDAGIDAPNSSGIDKLITKQSGLEKAQIIEYFTILYSQIATLMRAINDPKYWEFRDEPRVMGNLRSSATLQILRDNKIWPGSYQGKRISTLHRDCADYSTLQMYTNWFAKEFPKTHKSWCYVCVSKDTGLVDNLEAFRQADPRSKEITHPTYSRHIKSHRLTNRKKKQNMEAMSMTPRDFYFFLVRQLNDLTGIGLTTFEQLETGKLDKSYNLSKHGENLLKEVKEWKLSYPLASENDERFVEAVYEFGKKIAQNARDIGVNDLDSKTLEGKKFASDALKRTRLNLAGIPIAR